MDTIAALKNSKRRLEFEKNSSTNYYNITSAQFDLLKQLVQKSKPTNILEIGTSNGYSLLSILLGIYESQNNSKVLVHSVEVNKERFNKAQDLFQDIDLSQSNIELNLINDNVYNAPCIQLLKLQAPFDLIFIDCNQEEYMKMLDLVTQFNLIRKNSSLIFDNILSHEQSYNFYKYTDFKELGFKATLFPIHDGFLRLLKI